MSEEPAEAVRAAIEYGIPKVEIADPMNVSSFEIARVETPVRADPGTHRFEGFIFPYPSEEHEAAFVGDDFHLGMKMITEGKAVMRVGLMDRRADILIWRRLPIWMHEREFDRDRTVHKLYLRGVYGFKL